MRRRMLDSLDRLNQQRYQEVGDPEIQSRIAQYEMAYRMQTSVPELTDISDESQATLEIPTKIGGVSKIKITLPVTVTPDIKSTLAKQLIRSTISISTSDSRISKSIPVEISQ